ncbi:MAG: hypothetical protein IPM77_09775 [Crocinitomicaceae bacterium]|nr:hypothetical protein [Crocinitomicaceae bacterium]
MVNKPTNLKLNLKNGTHPIECNSYRVRYNKNGKLKDSVLHENTIWNLDGTLSSRTWYDAKGVVSLIDSYTYEKKESDSIITAHKGSYGNFKYYFNEKNILYKFESSDDSTFSSIKVRHLYTYDEAANFVEASINAPSSSSPDQIWKWGMIQLILSQKFL